MLVLKRLRFEQRTPYILCTCDLDKDFEKSPSLLRSISIMQNIFSSPEEPSQFVAVAIRHIKTNRLNLRKLVDWRGSNLSSLVCQELSSL